MRLMNRCSFSTRILLLAGLLMAIPAFTAPANAAPTWAGKFTLPYEVTWNKTVLPAGEYTVRVNSKVAPLFISSTQGNTRMFTFTPIMADSMPGGTNILVSAADGRHIVRSLNAPSLGVSFIFRPLSRSEREEIAKAGQLESLPLIMTKK